VNCTAFQHKPVSEKPEFWYCFHFGTACYREQLIVNMEQLIVTELFMKCHVFKFAEACNWTISWLSLIHFTSSVPTSLRYVYFTTYLPLMLRPSKQSLKLGFFKKNDKRFRAES
jgi:hypothetical protein